MARSKGKGGHDEGFHQDERWLITYADMITLLLAVFIVLYALSDTNVRKFTAFAESVSAAFNTDILRGSKAITVTTGQAAAPGTDSFDAGSGVIASDQRAVEANIKDFAVQQGIAEQISVERVPEGIAIRIGDMLLFASGRARLDSRSAALLHQVVAAVGALPNQLRVEGHTDDTPPAGPFYSDNWSLSTDRALAVLNAMAADGIAPARLSAAGYAEFEPLVPNVDDASRARNRRVDILILYPGGKSGQPFVPTEPSPGGTP
jgi:chemotaxis protein MotB